MSISSPNHAFLLSQISAGIPAMNSASSTFSATRTTYLEINPGYPPVPFRSTSTIRITTIISHSIAIRQLFMPPFPSIHSTAPPKSTVANSGTRSTTTILLLGIASTVSEIVKAAALKWVLQSNVDLRGSLGSFSKWMGSVVTKGMYIPGGIIAATFNSSHFAKSWTGFLLELAKIVFK
ncbi:hypothetical protein DL95DRAFT_453568 [Leptodontidium sp. 2 PMI_412]|nr:hypothetical protein DL95DRAFT_453568 [Leptodontidium sp. 2 PMI_412]